MKIISLWNKKGVELFTVIFFLFAIAACGKEDIEAEPDTNIPQPENPLSPDNTEETDESENVENGGEADDTEDESSQYYLPEDSDFMASWQVYWEESEYWNYTNGTWKKVSTRITDENTLDRSWDGWPYYITFLQESNGNHRLIWGYSAAIGKLSQILDAIENKGDIKVDNLYIDNGVLSGDVYHWIWYSHSEMIVLKNVSSGTIAHQWKISHFDGESFTVSPVYDFPNPNQMSTKYFYTRKYRKYQPKN